MICDSFSHIQPIKIVFDSRLFLTTLPRLKKHAERSHIYHTEREGLMSSLSPGLNFIDTGKHVAWLLHQKRLGRDEFLEREQPSDISGSNESIFRDVDPMSVAKFSSRE